MPWTLEEDELEFRKEPLVKQVKVQEPTLKLMVKNDYERHLEDDGAHYD